MPKGKKRTYNGEGAIMKREVKQLLAPSIHQEKKATGGLKIAEEVEKDDVCRAKEMRITLGRVWAESIQEPVQMGDICAQLNRINEMPTVLGNGVVIIDAVEWTIACEEHCGPNCRIKHCANSQTECKKWKQVEAFCIFCNADKVNPPKRVGIGLRPIENVAKDDFIIEYVGEAVPKQHVDNHTDKSYVKELGDGVYIDATHRGGIARYINHSREPNCVLKPCNLMGCTRLAIFALKDISLGTELTIDHEMNSVRPIKNMPDAKKLAEGRARRLKKISTEPVQNKSSTSAKRLRKIGGLCLYQRYLLEVLRGEQLGFLLNNLSKDEKSLFNGGYCSIHEVMQYVRSFQYTFFRKVKGISTNSITCTLVEFCHRKTEEVDNFFKSSVDTKKIYCHIPIKVSEKHMIGVTVALHRRETIVFDPARGCDDFHEKQVNELVKTIDVKLSHFLPPTYIRHWKKNVVTEWSQRDSSVDDCGLLVAFFFECIARRAYPKMWCLDNNAGEYLSQRRKWIAFSLCVRRIYCSNR